MLETRRSINGRIIESIKGLPNIVRTDVEVPGPDQDVVLKVNGETYTRNPLEVTQLEDGGVQLNFEPGRLNIPGTEKHFDNLAELLPDDILDPIGKRNDNPTIRIIKCREKNGKKVTLKG